MPTENEVVDRREAIEAAFEEHNVVEETASPSPAPAPAPTEAPSPAPSLAEPAEGDSRPASSVKEDPEAAPAPSYSVDNAPKSWRAPQRAQWDKLPPDVRQEVMRREREVTKVIGESGQARQFMQQFGSVLQPFEQRLRAVGAHPIDAVRELLRSDYILATAPKVQRAQFMARMIKEYDIDVHELDSALARVAPADPVAANLDQLLQQKLAPLQQYIAGIQQREQSQERQSQAQINQSIETMAEDPKYPHFEELRMDMADIVDLAAKRGVYLSLPDAYTRAVAMNPEVSKQVASQQATEAQKAANAARNAKAQRALGASVSVGGAPGGAPSGASGASDRRATIAAAFDNLGGR